MKISDIRRLYGPPSRQGFRALAAFSLEVNPEIKLFDLQLIEAVDGRLNVYPPKSGNGSLTAALAPSARQAIAHLVVKELHSEQHLYSRTA
ncbi:hypothetical protein [Rhizobium sp. WYCCWR 11146]|uniref:hypothetical protein n=1 Tax=Rhizobium sp. WYCCWR 11146 TaxID=2749833 RepID=UPI0015E6B9F3|nr:hypothetical protein [Rhizobium sp. WYCCWR 11146]MBA1345965.1 hypothetical protein [Rhizobium sp. WYCCWR 11146]